MALPQEIKAQLSTDPSKINPTGAAPEDLNEYQKSLDEQIKSLEQRYANPNYFKVAAGFLKPQLGGFFASLGSASEALGENIEQQRAAQLPIAQMRTQLAQSKILTGQNKLQSDEFEAYRASKKPMTPEIAERIISINPDSAVAKAVKEALASAQQIASTTQTKVNTAIQGQEAVAKNPFIVLNDPMFKGTVAEPSPDQIKKYDQDLNAARPRDTPIEQWNAMGYTDKANAVAKYAASQTMEGMEEEGKSALLAKNADNLLDDLTTLRTLAVDPKLNPIFSLFKNGDALGMLRAYLDKNPGNAQAAVEGLTAAALQNLQNPDKETRAKVDKLVKGIARLEVGLRGSNVNPTNAFQELNSAGSPSLANSQAGFVGILDQLGLQAKRDIDLHDLRVNSKIPSRALLTSPESRALRQKYRDEAEALAKSYATDVTPSWYKSTVSPAVQARIPTAPTTRLPPAAASNNSATTMQQRLQRAIAEREAQTQRP
jgi:hypothetical protein